jgi:hypothetical protein
LVRAVRAAQAEAFAPAQRWALWVLVELVEHVHPVGVAVVVAAEAAVPEQLPAVEERALEGASGTASARMSSSTPSRQS